MTATTIASIAIMRTDLTLLQTRDGRKVSFSNSQLLCGSCHGPTYRDWEAGAHGRTSGYWDRSLGPIDRKICANCHNPHSPHFPGRKPAPGPHLLHPVATASVVAPECRTINMPDGNCHQNPAPADSGLSPAQFSADVSGGDLRLRGAGRESGAADGNERFPDRRAVPAEVLQGDDAGGHGEGSQAHRERGGKAIRHSRPHVRDLKPMDGVRVCLLPEPYALHRLPQMRPRLRRGKQPVAQLRRFNISAC